jgi:hypothetical protein
LPERYGSAYLTEAVERLGYPVEPKIRIVSSSAEANENSAAVDVLRIDEFPRDLLLTSQGLSGPPYRRGCSVAAMTTKAGRAEEVDAARLGGKEAHRVSPAGSRIEGGGPIGSYGRCST